MTSPSWPVIVSLPVPGIAVASMKRTSPPTGVQARPVATPGRRVRRRCLGEEQAPAEQLAGQLRGDGPCPVEPPSATSRASLRQTVPIWRSRLRTPASRVYSSMIAGSAASVNSIWRRLQAVLADLAGDEVAAGDVELLVDRVAGQPDHLHPVAERRRDRVEDVRGGDEDDLGEVEVEVEVVVAERVVLGRIEHLEHRAGRIAAEVGAHLVDLVDHEDRVAGAGVAERPDDRARHRADVGAPVAADLRLVADAADRDPLELAARARGRSSGRGSSCRHRAGRRSRGSGRPSRA